MYHVDMIVVWRDHLQAVGCAWGDSRILHG